jgi:tryptophanyl-tRNA synthetase
VGEDQKQHLELTRDIAQSFNARYGETFVMPETKLPTVGARVMGLDDPEAKMAKSVTGANHAIFLLDDPKAARKKIMRAKTDTQPAVSFETMGPGIRNLLNIFQAFTDWTEKQMREHFDGKRYGDTKKEVAEAVIAGLEPIQRKYEQITADSGYVDKVLREAAERVEPIANSTVELVKKRMGLYV